MSDLHPEEIRVARDRMSMTVRWSDGVAHEITAEMLRVMSPSAEVQGHAPEQRKTVGGKRMVQITAVEMVGNYAVRISFDDMHSTGIYSWPYLRALGDERDAKWAAYEAELAEKGLSR